MKVSENTAQGGRKLEYITRLTITINFDLASHQPDRRVAHQVSWAGRTVRNL